MNSMLQKIGLGAVLAATAITTAVPAEAQRYRGGGYGYHGGYRHGDGTGTAIVAGVAGLAIGAALASNNNRRYYDNGYYNNGYYNNGYSHQYYRDNGYYNRPHYRGYDGYRGGYDGYRGYEGGYRDCYVQRRYDPYYGRPVHVRVCN